MTDAEFDYFNWRIDQLHKMLIELAHNLGQHEFADNSTQFHNNQVNAEWEHIKNERLKNLESS